MWSYLEGRTWIDGALEEGTKEDMWTEWGKKEGTGESCVQRNNIICTSNQILLGWSNQGGRSVRGMQHKMERSEMLMNLK
jgi:hypothetical protein